MHVEVYVLSRTSTHLTLVVPPTAIELAEASYAAAVTDYLRKKKSKLQHGSLLECVAKAPGLASAAQPLGVVAKEAGGTARNAYIQAKALELLLAHVRTLATTASTPTAPAPQATPASAASSTPRAPSAAGALKPQMKAISSALVAAVAGVGMKAEHQVDALKAAVGIVEAIKRLHPSSKLGEVMGPERINLVAKAVSTVRDLGTPDRVGAQLSRLSQVLSITDLLAKTQPDPALRAKISKARAQQAEAKQQQQQQQQQQKGQKGKEQGKKQQGAGKGKGGKQDGNKMQSKGKQGGRTKQDEKVGKEQTGGKVSKKQEREDLAAKQDVNAAKKPRKA
ncbi:hypothetical protein DUNSADRAFT_5044 [Dunaliella salina]|uniref:Uncharacterized protein n=1 Tax=Dunaliella salina TaxID=3046 RepID=A0ABQ7HAC9_DUNSA|nr:hypothetical protein DUNSADRAFT_5044 [Dunaliella salina]|eukprot:KAF5843807.1 hypothetical protein DUNSADRAFT_5044 [Dunaliella salina]